MDSTWMRDQFVTPCDAKKDLNELMVSVKMYGTTFLAVKQLSFGLT